MTLLDLVYSCFIEMLPVPVFWSSDAHSWLIGKVPDAGKDWGQKEKRASADEMGGWHHSCSGHELGQTSGDGEGQGDLVCCSPWGRKESDTTGWLNNSIILISWLLPQPFFNLFYCTCYSPSGRRGTKGKAGIFGEWSKAALGINEIVIWLPFLSIFIKNIVLSWIDDSQSMMTNRIPYCM